MPAVSTVPRVLLVSVAVALGMAAPCSSCTVPVTPPLVVCAAAGSALATIKATAPHLWIAVFVQLPLIVNSP